MFSPGPGPVHKRPLTTGNHPTNAVTRKHCLGIVTVRQQVVKAILEKKNSKDEGTGTIPTASISSTTE